METAGDYRGGPREEIRAPFSVGQFPRLKFKRVMKRRIGSTGVTNVMRLVELFAWQAHEHRGELCVRCPPCPAWAVTQNKATKAKTR